MSRRRRERGAINLTIVSLVINITPEEVKKIPRVKFQPVSRPLCSFLHLLPPVSPFLAVGCCVEDSDYNHKVHVLWSLCLSALDVSYVTVLQSAWSHTGETLRPDLPSLPLISGG